jgi:superfamily II DNA or RNA helicase
MIAAKTDSPWHHSTLHNSPCRIIEEETLFGQTICRIWLPALNLVTRTPRAALTPLASSLLPPELEAQRIAYVAAAARVTEVLDGNSAGEDPVLLAPMESNVIPLPHQLHALARALSGDRIRYLLADEVGLGKTIEAGLVMRELKLRGLVRRILVVAPKGLATQWVAEMETHFNETFQLVMGEDIGTLQRLSRSANRPTSAWTMFDQVIVSLDSVKPVEKRRGWTDERLAAYNRSRFEDLISAGWDLVVVDEAHRLGGSTDQVARYRLGQGLAEAAPYLLLLSATPHQGKSDAFHRLINLLDADAFPDEESLSRQRVAPYVIRTEKRNAIDAAGQPLFKPRRTQMIPIAWSARHTLQQLLYEAVTEYVREGYNQAMREQKFHIGFLMVLMQRLVISSTRAIKTTLERRLDVLRTGLNAVNARLDDSDSVETLYDLDGQELLDELLTAHLSALHNEGSQVAALLESARQCESAGPDAKAEALLDWIYRLQAEENDPDLKLLIFTEFVPTQAMLHDFLTARGISTAILNGSMNMDERRQAQDAFRHDVRVLVSTDAGGEGLNLQFCHVVINYDMPWNPMRLEQRIGRVDRIGQSRTVRALNFVFEESIEFRVREVLEEKLAVIFEEFGIDKTGDVLDSAQAGELFEDLFTQSYMTPQTLVDNVESTVARLRSEIQATREGSPLYGLAQTPDLHAVERLRTHPLPHWVERMTLGYLRAHGGSAVPSRTGRAERGGWDLTWPDGEIWRKCVFSQPLHQDNADAEGQRRAGRMADARLLTLKEDRIQRLLHDLPALLPGQSLPQIHLPDLPATVQGDWVLVEIRLATLTPIDESLGVQTDRRGYLPLFLAEHGAGPRKLYLPTARHIWELLQSRDAQVVGSLHGDDARAVYSRLLAAVDEAGTTLFDRLQHAQRHALDRAEARGEVAFAARRRIISRVGLPEVRHHRLTQLVAEETTWQRAIKSARQSVPEVRVLLMMEIV